MFSNKPPKNDTKHADDPKDAVQSFGPKDTKTNLAKENASPKHDAPDASPGAAPYETSDASAAPQAETGKNTVDGLNVRPQQLGNPATGAPLNEATGKPAQQGDVPSKDVIDPSLTDKGAVIDRIAAEHASLATPEIHKQAARKADERREHGAPAVDGYPDTLPADNGPRDITRDDIGTGDYAAHREVTVKLGSPAEADYISEGDVVSHVNSASGEVTFKVEKGSKSFTTMRARQVTKR